MSLIRFLIVGIANTLIGLSIIFIAMYYLHLDIVLANALGYLIGILVGFALNKTWTFNNNDHIVSSLFRYILVFVVAYLANISTVLFANLNFNISPYISQTLGIIPYTIIGFIGSRYFAFRIKKTSPTIKKPLSSSFVNKKPVISRMIDVSIVIPCYNEEEVLKETTKQLNNLLQQLTKTGKITPYSKVYYIDDGSSDKTWELIESLSKTYNFIHGIKLSRNRGHQNALLAGLLTAEGDVIISVDADLQDDMSAIKEMIEFYIYGDDIVYGVRDSRKSDTFFKRISATLYYQILNYMGVEIIYNHADYRLMSRQAIEALKEFGEVNLFLRGIVPQLGFSYSLVYYDRAERYAGESKYPLKKMLSFAWQGVTSFSDIPLRFITSLGLIVSLLSFLTTIWAILIRLLTQDALPGWASTVLPIYFLGGIQLLCLGIIGEYLAKIYAETKRRPRYIIEKTI